MRRPSEDDISTHKDYLPCIHCMGYLAIHMLSEHEKKCRLKPSGEKNLGQRLLKQKGTYKLMEDIGSFTPEMRKCLSKMDLDTIGKVVREDPTILAVGQQLLDRKYNKNEAIDGAKQQMRILSRILIQMRKTAGNEGRTLESFIRPTEFAFYMATIKEMTLNSQLFQLAQNFGYTVS